jgi:hypothetical protein
MTVLMRLGIADGLRLKKMLTTGGNGRLTNKGSDTMRVAFIFCLPLLLASCDSSQLAQVNTDTTKIESYVATGTTDANSIIKVATAALLAYEATPNPSAAVVNKANGFLNDATAAVAQYGPKAATAVAAAGSLATYVLTSAPGNGVTPSTSPVS